MFVLINYLMDNLVTTVGFIALGGLVAAIPVLILGVVLRSVENGN